MKESRKRSLVKALIYRVICTILSFVVPYLLTGDWAFSVSFGLIYSAILIIVYYLYERVWNRIGWGRI